MTVHQTLLSSIIASPSVHGQAFTTNGVQQSYYAAICPMLHMYHVAYVPCCKCPMLHMYHVAYVPCCICPMLHMSQRYATARLSLFWSNLKLCAKALLEPFQDNCYLMYPRVDSIPLKEGRPLRLAYAVRSHADSPPFVLKLVD